MIVVTSYPTRNVNDSPSLVSKWSAVHHPILFSLCRRDVQIIEIRAFPGLSRILVSSIPAGLAVGQKIHIVSGTINGEFTVTGISGNYIAIPPVGNSVGGYFNMTGARVNYIAEVQIMAVDELNTYYPVGTIEVKPAPDGTFRINVAGYLKRIADMSDTFLYNVINKKIVGAGSRFNIHFRESWKGFEGEYSALSSANVFYWTNATKQLQERYNFNVGEHVLFPTIDTAKFMSDFDAPTYFPGFPFSLSFIWSDREAGRNLQRVEEQFNFSDVSTGTVTTPLDINQQLAVNRLMIVGSYPATTKYIHVWLNDAGGKMIGYVAPGYVLPGYAVVGTGLPTIKPVRDAESN